MRWCGLEEVNKENQASGAAPKKVKRRCIDFFEFASLATVKTFGSGISKDAHSRGPLRWQAFLYTTIGNHRLLVHVPSVSPSVPWCTGLNRFFFTSQLKHVYNSRAAPHEVQI